MPSSFGQVIAVTGPNIGFPGAVSRFGERVIAARTVLTTGGTHGINFGDPVVLIKDSTGGTYQSVPDFMAGGGTTALVGTQFAGIAVRNIKTQLGFPIVPGAVALGSYVAGQMAEALERGSITVSINVGTPQAGGQVYVRTILNGTIPAGVVGGIEGAADGTNSVALTGVVFRTGYIDANGMIEITLLNRVAA
jgi:hypothetical protein